MSIFTDKDEATALAFRDPRRGDRFTEMYSYWMYVIARTGDVVTTMEASAPCSFPDDGKRKVQTVQEFRDRFAYGSIAGYWVHFVDSGNDVSGWATE